MNIQTWNIIGWIVLTAFVLVILFFIFIILSKVFRFLWAAFTRQRLHMQTRNIPPAKGQVWEQLGSNYALNITGIYENGRIVLQSGNASWGESPEDWKTRVKERKLYLIRTQAENL